MKLNRLFALLLMGAVTVLPAMAEVQTVNGKVVSVLTGPSNQKLERTSRGIHLIVQTSAESAVSPNKTINLHLGPEAWLQKSLKRIPKQQPLTFKVFKTAALPKDHYLVQSIETKDTVIQYRDGAMKPLWSKKR